VALVKQKPTARRRPVPKRPPSAASTKVSRQRVKKILVPLFSRCLQISLRKFRTNKSRRSKRYPQIAAAVNLFGVREIAVAFIKKPRTQRQRPARAHRPVSLILLPRTAAALLLITAGISSSVYFGMHLQHPVKFDITPAQTVKALPKQTTTVTEAMPRSIPTRLEIPSIGLDTSLSQVGLQADGTMQMPWDIETASWYKYSPTPGELGPAVIVGHLDGANYANMTGVFWRLHELKPGDQIRVSRTDGSLAVFKVLGLKQVSQSNFPTQEIYGNINYAGIRLITCGGTFDPSQNHYTDNTVVYGQLE
jgi:sortase (surface protein transpeptidase)